jgi:hypothetical protein
MLDTVDWALSRGLKVVVASPPTVSRRHGLREASLVEALKRRYADDGRVRHVSVAGEIDLGDPAFSFDGVHLTEQGNQKAGEHLVDTVFELLAQR